MAADVMAENAHLTYKFLSPVRQIKFQLFFFTFYFKGCKNVMNDCAALLFAVFSVLSTCMSFWTPC